MEKVEGKEVFTLEGVSGPVYTVVPYYGYVCIGGDFDQVGSLAVQNIACWQASTGTWSTFGSGVSLPSQGAKPSPGLNSVMSPLSGSLAASSTINIAIIPAAPVRARNRDVEYPYRPDSDFQYIAGFGEPEAVAVLIPGRDHGEYLLFCRERDPKMETWTGRRAGTGLQAGRPVDGDPLV